MALHVEARSVGVGTIRINGFEAIYLMRLEKNVDMELVLFFL